MKQQLTKCCQHNIVLLSATRITPKDKFFSVCKMRCDELSETTCSFTFTLFCYILIPHIHVTLFAFWCVDTQRIKFDLSMCCSFLSSQEWKGVNSDISKRNTLTCLDVFQQLIFKPKPDKNIKRSKSFETFFHNILKMLFKTY